jgi:hypothetical protein
LAATFLQPEPAAADLQPNRTGIAATNCLAGKQDAGLPQNFT